MRKVFVVGLDGVGFDLITPWIESGKLPNLGSLLEEGAQGTLRSTVPPVTGPAWSSFQTGVNPGKHGVFGWTGRKADSYRLSVINSQSISCPTIWELASENGRRVVSIGVPMTYPPRPINGIVIPGILTPQRGSSPTYPSQIYSELCRSAPGYCFFPDCAHHFGVRAKVRELSKCVRGRAKAAQHFMQRQDWDLFMLHFQSTDVVQHELWGIEKAGINPVLSVFQEVDKQVGKAVKIAQQMGASVIIVSDHGMGPLEFTFSVNSWLLASGQLRLKNGLSTHIKRIMFRLGFTQGRLQRFGSLLYPLAYRLGIINSYFDAMGDKGIGGLLSSVFLSAEDIDWKRTKAYSRSDIGHIYLNLKGREPQGVVGEREAEGLINELVDRLKDTMNPHSGEPLLGEVFRKEEIYHGNKLSQAPDILFLPKGLRTIGSGVWQFYSSNPFDRPITRAHHRMEGVVVAVGEPFKSGYHLKGAALVDLAPNILYLLDCPIPRYMDGELWERAYLPAITKRQPPRWTDLSSDYHTARPVKTTDEEEIKQRLRNLGYLS